MRSWCQFHEFTYFMPWKISRAIKISAHLCQFQPFHHDLTWFHQKMSWKKNTFFMSPGNSWTNRAARVSRIYIAMVDLNLRKSSKHSRTNIVLTAQDSCTSQHFDTGRASYTSIGFFFSESSWSFPSLEPVGLTAALDEQRLSRIWMTRWPFLQRLHQYCGCYRTIQRATCQPLVFKLDICAKQSSSHRAVV